MLDKFNRQISYVRISVTDRCNLRCTYCMPQEGVTCVPHSEVISFEEIRDFVSYVVPLGITKVRITGGEPLVRKGIVDLIEMLSIIPGLQDLAMTTNGILLPTFAQPLRDAGLKRLNISLDTMNAKRFESITRGGDINNVFRGIQAAQKAGFTRIKINAVKLRDSENEDIESLRMFCEQENLELRFIQQMNLKTGEFSIVEGGEGGNCSVCNRLRLTATGMLKPCLFSEFEYSIRELGIQKALSKTLQNKPLCGSKTSLHEFYTIGG